MRTVVVFCEGQTEAEFINDFLYLEMFTRGILLNARFIKTSQRGRGGALTRQRVLSQLSSELKQRSDTYVTTFFDLYRLPDDFPGVAEAKRFPDPLKKASQIEKRLGNEILQGHKTGQYRLRPHIQPLEFEALVFSNVDALGELEPSWASQIGPLQECRAAVATPEHINDGPDTHPSKRLEVLSNPDYRKVLHGPLAIHVIGLARLREQCIHFDGWVSWIESLTAE